MLVEINRDAPSFDVPKHFRIELELQSPTPRAVPDSLREGEYERSRRSVFAVVAALALCFALLGNLPATKPLQSYVLPLAYCNEIAALFAIICVSMVFLRRFSPGRYAYVIHGVAFPAKITRLEKIPTAYHHGMAITYGFRVELIFRDPETGEVKAGQATSQPFSADARHRYECSAKVGDFVTAVALPGKVGTSLSVYGFLGLNPQVSLIQYSGKRARPIDFAIGVVAILGFFAVLMENLYALSVYPPLDMKFISILPLCGLTGAALVLPYWVFLIGRARRAAKEIAARNRAALSQGTTVERDGSLWIRWDPASCAMKGILFAGSIMLSTLTVLCLALMVNAVFDQSPGFSRDVPIEGVREVTRSNVFRSYEVKFLNPATGEHHTFSTSESKMKAFLNPQGEIIARGKAEVHEGYLGWTWLKDLTPG